MARDKVEAIEKNTSSVVIGDRILISEIGVEQPITLMPGEPCLIEIKPFDGVLLASWARLVSDNSDALRQMREREMGE